tara:strand:- start:1018 stop:1422 length:405 start_codon:yes stop_codon:yes gene_type:complete
MLAVPVPDLLQVTHPGYRYVNLGRRMTERDVPTFLDYCIKLTERFEHYGDINVTPIDLFPAMIKSFDTLYNNDDPQDFLPAVKLLHGLLEEYDLVVDNMQRAFLNNPRVSNFYRDVASTLRCIFESIMVSDIDD